MAKYKPIKKGKALPRRKKKDIFPEKVSEAKLKRQAKKGARAGIKAVRGLGPDKKVARKEKVRKYVSGVKKRVREYHAERGQKRAEVALKDMGGAAGLPSKKPKKRGASVSKLKSALQGVTRAGRRKKIGAAKGTKVRKGAVGVQKTKGGEYVKYGKKSAAAGSFRKAFKSGCAGGAKSFSWDGRSYSCKKK